MTIHQEVLKAGIEVGSHYSDLYVKVTPVSTEIVNQYEYKKNVTTFVSQIDGTLWYDIPFAYDGFFESKGH